MNGVAVVSCSCDRTVDIIRNILGTENLPEPLNVTDQIQAYLWPVETKYYTANLNLLAVSEKELLEKCAVSIEAVLIHFNNTDVESFKEVERWLPFIEKLEPSVKLLTCNNYTSDGFIGISKSDVQTWCLKNQFELIELHPNEDSDEEDGSRDSKGYPRVIQALHSNVWSDLHLKDSLTFQTSADVISPDNEAEALVAEKLEGAHSASNSTAHADETKLNDKATTEKIDALFEEDRWLFEAVGREDPGGEAFEAMFSRILNMKDKASSLSGDEKKLYAEKVAVEFWKALGGEDEEIAGISSDES